MNEQEMQARSSAKVKQVTDLMKILYLTHEVRERVDPQTGFIEKMVYWIDSEKYPAAAPASSTGKEEAAPEASTKEIAPGVQEVKVPAEPAPEEHAA